MVLLEQAHELGGLGRSPALAGVPMNLGPHALYLGGPAERALLELGVSVEGFVPRAGGFFESDGALFPMPSTPLSLLTASWLSWSERVELAWAMREVLSTPRGGSPVSAWLAKLRSARVRGFFSALIRVSTYCNAPEVLTTRLAFAQLDAVLSPGARGVLYLDGGWQRVVDQLGAKSRELGVEVRTGARVTQLEATTVTCADGTKLSADEVALAVPLAAAARLTGDPALQRRVEGAKPVRAACLELVLTKLPRPERRLVLGFEQPTYFSVHSRPEAQENLKVHVAWYLEPDDVTDALALERRLEDFVERVQPGWRDGLLGRRFFPHLRVMEDVPREVTTTLRGPLHLVSTVATSRFLFDGVVSSIPSFAVQRESAR